MLHNIVANPTQLSAMTKVLNDHCRAHAIVNETDRNAIASKLLAAFGSGTRSETELVKALKRPDVTLPTAA